MKYFNKFGHVNFVDDNNVFVGYDLNMKCCEDAFWNIYEDEDGSSPALDLNSVLLDPFVFDTTYSSTPPTRNNRGSDYDLAVFKLVIPDTPAVLYIILQNHQNGHYSHGFTANIGGLAWCSGTI